MPDPAQPQTATLLVSCPDQRGIVAALAQVLYGHGANILDADQHTDAAAGVFFQRIRFDTSELRTDRTSLEAALGVMRRRTPDALMTTSDPVLSSFRAGIVGFATERRLVSMYGDRIYVSIGGLMFYGTSTAVMWRQAAIYVDRIFKGAKPGDLPVEQPTKFELVINLKTAKALDLTIPPTLPFQADEVIK